MSDYNNILFSMNKIADGKKKAKKIKARAAAKALALTQNTEIINQAPENLTKATEITIFKPFIQPMHNVKYNQTKRILMKSNKAMKPHATSSSSYDASNYAHRLTLDYPVGSPEWYSYTGLRPPPFVYSTEYTELVKKQEYRNQVGIQEVAASKIPTPEQSSNPRVLIISCEYAGTDFKLNGCFNDSDKFRDYILSIYPNAELTYLTDDPTKHNYDPTLDENNPRRYPDWNDHTFPSKDTILKNLVKLCKSPNKLLFLFFAGHGGTADDIPAPLEDTLVDTDANGVVKNTFTASDLDNPKHRSTYYFANDFGGLTPDSPVYDNEMYDVLQYVSSSQKMYIFTDCCHSGTIFNLPYVNLTNYMYQYDSSGNAITELATEKDDFGHDVHDAAGNPIKIQNKLYNKLNDIPHNVANVSITTEDIETLMTDANTVITVPNHPNLNNTKIYNLSAKYPSLANMKGNIIHFSGTRDNKFSFESVIYDASGNVIDRDGAFTWHLRRLWQLGLQTFTLKKLHICLTGLMNNPEQIPLCSTSKHELYNDTDLLVEFAPSAGPSIVPATKKINKNKNMLKTLTKFINKKTNIINQYDVQKVKTILNAKNIFKPSLKKNKKSIASPVQEPVQGPVQEPVVEPVQEPVVEPVQAPVPTPKKKLNKKKIAKNNRILNLIKSKA